MTSPPIMRCYLIAVRILRTKCFLILFLLVLILFLGRIFQHKRHGILHSIFSRSNVEYDFFRPFFSNYSRNHRFIPGQFMSDYIPQNYSYCNYKFGLPHSLVLQDSDIEYPPELGLDSEYRVVYNVIESSFVSNLSIDITYCTHATPEFIFYLVEILHRWQGPVSIATFVPNTDVSLTICILERLCKCLPDMSRVSLHFVFPSKFPPKLSKCSIAVQIPHGCTIPYGLKSKTIQSFRAIESLTYPVNVARNTARINVRTTFILVSDVELFPSKNLVVNFIKMVTELQKESGAGLEACINKLVYVLPVFEVQSNEEIPDVKSKLLQLYSQSQAFYFHRWVCSHCQRFPGLQRWLLRKSPLLDNKIEPFFVVRREFPFHRWEPVFIGTNADPLYSEMLSWEGQQDKMTQISKRRRREQEENDKQNKEESEETNSSEAETPEADSAERFSTVDLSSKDEPETEEGRTSRGEQFFDRLKRSSVGKLFKSENKEQDISIYTIDRGNVRERAIDVETRLQTGELTTKLRRNAQRPSEGVNLGRSKCVATQANDYPPFRLYFLPPRDWKETESTVQSILKLICCQCSLACFLLVWLIFGALVFYLTEGSFEEQLQEEINIMENSTIVSMATDLRLLDPELDPWDDVLIKYSIKHREEIIAFINKGYKNDTIIWTFPGSLLSAVSILTTFGLAAPLPRTTSGIIGGAVFACLGIPIQVLFILNLGRTIATKVQVFAKEAENKASDLRQRIINVRRFGEDLKRETWPEKMFFVDFKPPAWLSYFPIISMVVYYTIGLLVFGIARGLYSAQALVFFIDFSRGYPSNGFSRMGYSWYLEGGAILTGLNIALLRDSPLVGLTELAHPYGLMTNSID